MCLVTLIGTVSIVCSVCCILFSCARVNCSSFLNLILLKCRESSESDSHFKRNHYHSRSGSKALTVTYCPGKPPVERSCICSSLFLTKAAVECFSFKAADSSPCFSCSRVKDWKWWKSLVVAGAADQVAEAEAAASPAAGRAADTARGTTANGASTSPAATANSTTHCRYSTAAWRGSHRHYCHKPASYSSRKSSLTWQKQP